MGVDVIRLAEGIWCDRRGVLAVRPHLRQTFDGVTSEATVKVFFGKTGYFEVVCGSDEEALLRATEIEVLLRMAREGAGDRPGGGPQTWRDRPPLL